MQTAETKLDVLQSNEFTQSVAPHSDARVAKRVNKLMWTTVSSLEDEQRRWTVLDARALSN
jgi:hypothetical protein